MKRSAALVAIAVAFGISACTSTPAPEQNAAPGTGQESAPTVPVVTEVVTATVTNPPQAQDAADDRLGYGALKLGMTLDEVRAAGLTDLTWDSDGDGLCVGDDKAAISKKHGVVRITLPKDARTSKGIGVGSSHAEVMAAYPDASEYRAGWSANIGDMASYAFIGHDEVTDVKMRASSADCAEFLL
ncbi:hypothetical protein [Lentzea albida]|uniref:Lipoprotein n=1 Tax=Lentzea albida TaxID=65499 RepID=A0A1H9A8S1_9PSEU|nr:hypothetical protein [Lentzea albida]SEP73132.1 hypothetical protein SAMN04488000_10170 [Lentzea albida]